MVSVHDRFQPAARTLFEAWANLPKIDGVPARGSFDPTSVARILPVLSIFQRAGADDWRLRLVGTEVERRWGRSLTGLSYYDLMSPEMAAATLREFEAICGQPCGSWSLRQLGMRSGRRLQTEALRLPLRGADGAVTLILSSNAELKPGAQRGVDRTHAILTIVEQEFFDIGSGIPPAGCLAPLQGAA